MAIQTGTGQNRSLIQCLLQVSIRFDGNFDINLGEHVLQESPMSLYGPVLGLLRGLPP